MKPIVLTVSTGRCGTTFLEKTFKLNFDSPNNWISHEHLKQNITNVGVYHRCFSGSCVDEMANDAIRDLVNHWLRISQTGPVVDFGWTMRSLIPYLQRKAGPQLKILYIHRHPIEVAASYKLIGSYSIYNSPQWAITPWHPRAQYPQFQDRWKGMTPFEKCLYLWLEVNAAALELQEQYSNLGFLSIKSDLLFKNNDTLESIAKFTGFYQEGIDIKRSGEKNRRQLFLLERRPVEAEWINYKKHPEVISLGDKLGYNMEEDYVVKLISKYQLPKGLMPFLRNRSGFWAHKENAGRLLRSIKSKNT
jgi:hypothetical protein